MTTMYTIVRYVPDTTAGEFINIGVLVWGDGAIRARFLDNWKRVEPSDPYVIEALDRFAASFGPDAEDPLQEGDLTSMIDGWGGAIQFAPARPSGASPEATLEAVAADFLRQRVRPSPAWGAKYPDDPRFLRTHTLSIPCG